MDIVLPGSLSKILSQNTSLESSVSNAFKAFGPWLEASGMPFFPGFTDHSPRHINEVLETATSLVSDEARGLLTGEDAGIISLAILLHDCGMHLTQDGFRSLIQDEGKPVCPSFDSQTWSELWQEFVREASRFSQQKLQAIFGDTTPVDAARIDVRNLSERDLLLAGEFVRRHHARLAHEIAIRGVPPFARETCGSLRSRATWPTLLD